MMVTRVVKEYINNNLSVLTDDLRDHMVERVNQVKTILNHLENEGTKRLNKKTIKVQSDFNERFSDRFYELLDRKLSEGQALLTRVVVDKTNRDMSYINSEIMAIVTTYKIDIDDFLKDLTKYIKNFKKQVSNI